MSVEGILYLFILQYLFFKFNDLPLNLKRFCQGFFIWIMVGAITLLFHFFIPDFLDVFRLQLFFLLMSIVFLRPLNNEFYVFYAFFPLTLWSVFNRVFNFFIPPIMGLKTLELGGNDWPWYLPITFEMVAIVLVFLVIKTLQYDFSELRKGAVDEKDRRLIRLSNIAMLAYHVIMQFLIYLTEKYGIPTYAIRELLVVFYIIFFMGIINRLDRHLRDRLQEKMNFQQELQIENLTGYSKHIEELYREVRGFRHDYSNLLLTLRLGIENNDMTQIEKVYQSVLGDSNKRFRHAKYDIERLINIKDTALKSLLASKLIQALESDISVNVEIPEEIEIKGIELVDFITIVGILCDNALEANQPEIHFAYFEQDNKQLLIVENPIDAESIDVNKIFYFGESSKGDRRGVGLYNVMKIAENYPNVSLKTTSEHYKLTQVLEIIF